MPGKQLTNEQKIEILNSDLTNVELGKIYGKHPDTISKIRLKAGKGRGRVPNKFSGHHRVTDEQLKIVKNPQYTRREVHKITGISEKHISKLRDKHNVPIVKKRPMNPKIKNIVVKPKKEPKPKPKERIVTSTVLKYGKNKAGNITEKPLKIQANTTDYERTKIVKLQVSDIVKNQVLTESEKIANGSHKWVTRINQYGKTERAFIKI